MALSPKDFCPGTVPSVSRSLWRWYRLVASTFDYVLSMLLGWQPGR